MPTVAPIASPVSTAPAPNRIPIQTLGQNDFLKLLVTQMTAQDPLNPQKDTEFIAQMAQFSALEQNKAMQTDMAQLRTQQQVVQANELIGKTVEIQVAPDVTARGSVSAVQIKDGTPSLIINGQPFDLSQVRMIQPGAVSQPILP
jgi:flagellar basal-body rod modification protein FlgD